MTPAGLRDGVRLARQWVLIADDDHLIREMLRETLTTAGYRTLQAATGREALELIRDIVPDLLILDLHMPDLSGDDVLAHLRQSAALRTLPVLIITAFDDTAPDHHLGLNIVGFLEKPFRLAELLRAVEAAFTSPPQSASV